MKNQFLENLIDANSLLEARAQICDLDETTSDPIQKSLIGGLKSSILKQQLVNSQHATDMSKYFVGKKSAKGRKKIVDKYMLKNLMTEGTIGTDVAKICTKLQ